MKITDVRTVTFKHTTYTSRDSEGHGHPGPAQEATQSLLMITTDDGITGYCFGANPSVIEKHVKPTIMGQDPFFREKIWQTLKERQRLFLTEVTDRVLCTVDLALWDLNGRILNQPVYKLLGATRTKVPAYGSTMVGDDLKGGLDTPQAYADFAVQMLERGYKAIKLHTWQTPIIPEPSIKMDIAACKAVREAVGDDIVLMLDPYHYYSRSQALYLGRALEDLGFYWLEEPMAEHSISSYVWLTEQLDLLIVGPETAEGKMHTRAEWIVRNASDISRAGVTDVGGITPMMKCVSLAEAHGVALESHGNHVANLHVLCAMSIPGEYHERGLLHPFVDYEKAPEWLHEIGDPMDDEGYVHISDRPGLGQLINFDYINRNLVAGEKIEHV